MAETNVGFRTILWLIAITSSLAGVQFVYSIQFAVGTPLFANQLYVNPSTVAVILATAGPISGFIVQPIVGVLSDRYTSKYGRRRPFILVGTIFCACGMALIGNSVQLGALLGDKNDGETTSDHTWGLVFAIIGLWIMNLFVNVIQGPARAIVSDIVPDEMQHMGNAMVSNVMGMAAIMANVVGAQFFGTSQPYRWLFVIGIGFVIMSAIPTLIFAKETPYVKSSIQDEEPTGVLSVFGKIWKGFRYMPKNMISITFLYFFSWAAFSPFMIYITNYFGENIKGGDPKNDKDLYQDGVKLGMYGLAIFAVVQWMYSFILPVVIKITNAKVSYFLSQAIATACYVLFVWNKMQTIYFAWVLMGILAINFTTFNSVPFALVSSIVSKNDAGLYMGVLNSASVVSQTVTNTLAGVLVKYLDENVAWGIAFGGSFSLIACLLVWIIPKEKSDTEETKPLLDSDA